MTEMLASLMSRSGQLKAVLTRTLDLGTHPDEKFQASRVMCGVMFEHAESVQLLAASGNFTSALGLVRIQYDALVRSIWLLYAAPPSLIETLSGELTNESVKKADRVPNMAEMLEEMRGKAPDLAMDLLDEFKLYSWKPLSSWVHGGMHAFHRHSTGYPEWLLVTVLKASNGLSVMAAAHLIAISGDPAQKGMLPALQGEFADCLPPPKPPAAHPA